MGMGIEKNIKSGNIINFVILQDTAKSLIIKSNLASVIKKYLFNSLKLLRYFAISLFCTSFVIIAKIIYLIRLNISQFINFYIEISDVVVDRESRAIFLFEIKVFSLITISKIKNIIYSMWFFARKLYLIITVIVLIFGLKISSNHIKPNLNHKSFINKAFDNYSTLQNKANVLPVKAQAITTTNKEIIDIFPLNKIKVKAEQKISEIAQTQNLKIETIQINNNLEDKDLIPNELKELIVPWQDGFVYFPKTEMAPKELADKYKIDEKIIYEANEDKLNETGKFKKDTTIILPTKDFTEIKKVILKEKELLMLEERYKQIKDNQSRLAKSYLDQFSDPNSGGYKYANTKSEDKVSAGLIWPTKGSISRCLEPGHPGCDIANSAMPPVYAVADGVVSDVYRFSVYGYGNAVVVDHGNGLTSLSAHLNEIYVTKGQAVTQGQSIGQMGNTGNSTGTHLHIEIKLNRVVQNPLAYFP